MRQPYRILLQSAVTFVVIAAFNASFSNPADQNVPADKEIQQSIVQVKVSAITYDYARPWIREASAPFTVAGLVLPGRRILVLANDIRGAAVLEVTKFSSYKRTIAKLVILDLEANMALLSVDAPGFFDDLRPMSLDAAADPRPGESLTAVKVDDVFRVFREAVNITEVNPSADFGFTYLPSAAFRSSEPIRSGGVLLRAKKAVGFVGYADSDKRAEAIPGSVMEHFRRRAMSGTYQGFAAPGCGFESLADPVLRAYYHVPDNVRGPIVVRVILGGSAEGVLEKEDVLISMAGRTLDEMGYYDDPVFGRQHAFMLFFADGKRVRDPGETMPVQVFRKGKKVELAMKLKSYTGKAERIPWIVTGQPSYVMESGFVFLELSVPFLNHAYGANWRSSALDFAHTFDTQRYYDKPSTDRVIILGRVLPDPMTQGYENLGADRVDTLQDAPVKNLAELKRHLDELAASGLPYATARLHGGKKVFINLKDRSLVNARIMSRYGIPKPAVVRAP